MAKQREIKTRGAGVNLAQDNQACSGELLRVLGVLRGAVVNLAQDAQACSGKLLRVLR